MVMYSNIISVAQLRALPSQDVLILDVRHSLMDFAAGRRAYASGHIPNAYFLDMETDLSGVKNGVNGRHPLPDFSTLAHHLSSLGLRTGMQVVAYDDAAGAMAARVWWLLRSMGHEAVAVLDGGIPAWEQAGCALSSDTNSSLVRNTVANHSSHFHVQASLNRTVSATDILIQLPTGQMTLVDARSPERFYGIQEPIDSVAGHIPTARNHFLMNNVDATGRFLSSQQLRALWSDVLGDAPIHSVVHYCGSGVTACHNLLSMHIAKLDVSIWGAAIFAGSWSEWIADPSRPVAR